MMIMVVMIYAATAIWNQMEYGKTHKDPRYNLSYDIKCIESNQNYYIICITETERENGIKEKTISRSTKT